MYIKDQIRHSSNMSYWFLCAALKYTLDDDEMICYAFGC